MKKGIFTVVFTNEELEKLLGLINLKSSLNESLENYPRIEDTNDRGLVVFLHDDYMTHSDLYELFIFNGDVESPYIYSNEYYPYLGFIDEVIKRNPK